MPRIQGLAESGILTADTLLKSGKGYCFSITIAFKGVTAGEFCTLIDGTDISGTDEVVFIFPAANGTITKEWPQGKEFAGTDVDNTGAGIFFNKGATTGQVWAELTYK